MRTVRNVAILDVLPGQVPADVDRLVDSLAVSGDAPRVVVNLSGLDLVASLLWARLLALHRAIKCVEGRLILCCFQPVVRETLTFTKLDMIFDMADDEEAALADL
jgi:anti-anti-sigma factor